MSVPDLPHEEDIDWFDDWADAVNEIGYYYDPDPIHYEDEATGWTGLPLCAEVSDHEVTTTDRPEYVTCPDCVDLLVQDGKIYKATVKGDKPKTDAPHVSEPQHILIEAPDGSHVRFEI